MASAHAVSGRDPALLIVFTSIGYDLPRMLDAVRGQAGDETVIVVEDTPTRIVLQHILVDAKSGHVTKHWRQDWFYEAPTRFEFTADQTWHVRSLPADATRGAWTQCVYEVSDAPRYCGTGRWDYANGVATWTSRP